MSLVVAHNQSALNIQRQLFSVTNRLDQSFERLSSGFRINSAADDAAGLQIADRLQSDVISTRQVVRNLNDGISYAQIAEGALDEVNTAAQRMRQLAVQAQNGIHSDSDRLALDKEFQQLKSEIDRIAYETEAFDRHPLLSPSTLLFEDSSPDNVTLGSGQQIVNNLPFSGSGNDFYFIPADSENIRFTFDSYSLDDDIHLFTTGGEHLAGVEVPAVGDPLADFNWQDLGIDLSNIDSTFLTTGNGFDAGASYDASNINAANAVGTTVTYSGDGDLDNDGRIFTGETDVEIITLTGTTNQDIILAVSGQSSGSSYQGRISWDRLGGVASAAIQEAELADENPEEDVKITTSAAINGPQDYHEIAKTPATAADLGLTGLSLSSQQQAEVALNALSGAIDDIGEKRAGYGAVQNAMQSNLRNLSIHAENTRAAQSQIRDTDYASETASLARNQIIQQASQSLLSQANQRPEIALTLLNG